MTREEAIIQLRLGPGINEDVSEKYNDAVNIAIEALEADITKWRTWSHTYDNACIDGTLEVKVEDATKVGRVLISDDKHRGGLYYPDEDEGDLISRHVAIEAIEIVDWYHQNSNKDMVHGANDDEHQAWYKADDVYKALEAVPSAEAVSQSEQYKKGFEDAKRAFLVEHARESQNMRKRIAQLEVMLNAQKAISADRPKGEWIHIPNGIDRDFVWWTCSECGHKIFSETEKDRIEFHAYCGRCGADMRGDQNEASESD